MRRLFLIFAISASLSSLTHAQALTDATEASPVVQQPTDSSAKGVSPVSVSSSGLLFSTEDGSYSLHLQGYAQADDRWFSSNMKGEPLDTFFFRRIRPLFEGTIFNSVDYRFMPDFGQNNAQIQEAYMEWRTFSFAKLRVGKFKESIGLEVLRQDRDLSFPERSLASDLLPLRYMGTQLGGSLFADSINYEVGYFNGSNDGSNGNFQWVPDNEVAARLFLKPFAKTSAGWIRNLGFGMAGSSANQRGAIAGFKTVAQSTFFKYSSKTLANGSHNRISPQAYYYAGPVGLMCEYVVSSQDVINKSHTADVRNEAWEVSGSVMLTGEKNSYSAIRPRNSFEPTRGFRHLGAVEFTTRFSQLRIDGDAFPLFASTKTAAQQAQERGIGVNWYLNRFIKLTSDYEHTSFRMALSSVTPLHSEDVLMSRVQLAF